MTTDLRAPSLFCPTLSVVSKDLYSKYMEKGEGALINRPAPSFGEVD